MALRYVPLHAIHQPIEGVAAVLSEYFFEQVDDFVPLADELVLVEGDAAAEIVRPELDDGGELVAPAAEEQFLQRLEFVVFIQRQSGLALRLAFLVSSIILLLCACVVYSEWVVLFVLGIIICSAVDLWGDSINVFGSKLGLLDLLEHWTRFVAVSHNWLHARPVEG